MSDPQSDALDPDLMENTRNRVEEQPKSLAPQEEKVIEPSFAETQPLLRASSPTLSNAEPSVYEQVLEKEMADIRGKLEALDQKLKNATVTLDNQAKGYSRDLNRRLDSLEGRERERTGRENYLPPKDDEALVSLWATTPLSMRLKFLLALSEGEEVTKKIASAERLVGLLQSEERLQNALLNYPGSYLPMFEEIASLTVASTSPLERSIMQTICDLEKAFSVSMEAQGLTWVLPSVGDVITYDHQVIGEEPGEPGTIAGTVSRRVRRGVLFRGMLKVPAHVIRVAPSTPVEKNTPFSASLLQEDITKTGEEPFSPVEQNAFSLESHSEDLSLLPFLSRAMPEIPAEKTLSTLPEESPVWLARLDLLKGETTSQDQAKAMTAFVSLVSKTGTESDLLENLTTLFPLFGTIYQLEERELTEEWREAFLQEKETILDWLKSEKQITLIFPQKKEAFNPQTMRSVQTRSTYHDTEHNTVFQLESPGVAVADRVILPAHVTVYGLK